MIALILSLLGLGGGLGALAYFLGPAAMLGFGRSALAFLRSIPWQAYAIAALVGLIAFLMISRGHFIDRAHQDEARIANFCNVVRIADHNPKLDCAKAEAQVELMGQALTATIAELAKESATVDALSENSAQQQKIAAEAEKQAKERGDAAEAVSARLRQSARSAASQRAPGDHCETSDVVKGQWQ